MLPGRAMLLCLKKLEQMEQRIRSLEDQLKQQDIRNIARAHGQAHRRPLLARQREASQGSQGRMQLDLWVRSRWPSIQACVDPRH